MKRVETLLVVIALAVGHATDAQAQKSASTSQREIYGIIDSIAGSRLVIHTRTGDRVQVDALKAMARRYVSAPLFAGRAVVVRGAADSAGVLHAESIWRVKQAPATWPPD